MVKKSFQKAKQAIKNGFTKALKKLRLRKTTVDDLNLSPPAGPFTRDVGENSQPLARADATQTNQTANTADPQATRFRGRSNTVSASAASGHVVPPANSTPDGASPSDDGSNVDRASQHNDVNVGHDAQGDATKRNATGNAGNAAQDPAERT